MLNLHKTIDKFIIDYTPSKEKKPISYKINR